MKENNVKNQIKIMSLPDEMFREIGHHLSIFDLENFTNLNARTRAVLEEYLEERRNQHFDNTYPLLPPRLRSAFSQDVLKDFLQGTNQDKMSALLLKYDKHEFFSKYSLIELDNLANGLHQLLSGKQTQDVRYTLTDAISPLQNLTHENFITWYFDMGLASVMFLRDLSFVNLSISTLQSLILPMINLNSTTPYLITILKLSSVSAMLMKVAVQAQLHLEHPECANFEKTLQTLPQTSEADKAYHRCMHDMFERYYYKSSHFYTRMSRTILLPLHIPTAVMIGFLSTPLSLPLVALHHFKTAEELESRDLAAIMSYSALFMLLGQYIFSQETREDECVDHAEERIHIQLCFAAIFSALISQCLRSQSVSHGVNYLYRAARRPAAILHVPELPDHSSIHTHLRQD